MSDLFDMARLRPRMKKTRKAGDKCGLIELISERGNPEHGPSLYWDVRCLKCGRVWALENKLIGQVSKQKSCSYPCKKAQANRESSRKGDGVE